MKKYKDRRVARLTLFGYGEMIPDERAADSEEDIGMKRKKLLTAALMMLAMLIFCGCGRQQANNEADVAIVAQMTGTEPEDSMAVTSEQETAEPEATAVTEETKPAREIAKPMSEPEAAPEPEATKETEPAAEVKPMEETEPEEEAKPDSQAGEPAPEPETEPELETVDTESEKPEAEPPATDEDETAAEAAEKPIPPVGETLKPVERKVEITVPAKYADEKYQTGEITWNEDGSAMYRLTEAEYEQLLEEVHADIQKELDRMCASFYFPNFYSMTANEDCTVFTVVCLSIETSKAEQRSIPKVYELGRKYAAYQGAEPGNIHIDYMTMRGNTFVMRDSDKDDR